MATCQGQREHALAKAYELAAFLKLSTEGFIEAGYVVESNDQMVGLGHIVREIHALLTIATGSGDVHIPSAVPFPSSANPDQ